MGVSKSWAIKVQLDIASYFLKIILIFTSWLELGSVEYWHLY